ncbi:MAG TPA: sulfopyruvate decarboxylase subunit alpha [Dissulfurispiraceae bacterium]
MRYPEEELTAILERSGVDFTASLPCEKIKALLERVESAFFHVPLTREEEGVGICAGAALAGKRPAMFLQSSGIGNMINALLSLTGFYRLPLALFISQRGIYKEKIEAQFPMGKGLPKILRGAGVPFSVIGTRDDFRTVEKKLPVIYRKNSIHAFLLSPALWEASNAGGQGIKTGQQAQQAIARVNSSSCPPRRAGRPQFTRYEILDTIAPYLDAKAVVCNLGFPSKELFLIKHQPSNFYMLGSMGMATPIGLGMALSSQKEVVVIDGDGSILMNPGSLATAAYCAPRNLTIAAIDNGAYGSTGNQPTLARACVDLETAARGFGIKNTLKTARKKELIAAMEGPRKGLTFIHALAVPGNKDVPPITLHHFENRDQVMDFLKE